MITEYILTILICFSSTECVTLSSDVVETDAVECKRAGSHTTHIMQGFVKHEYPGVNFTIITSCQKKEEEYENLGNQQKWRRPRHRV